MHLRRGIVAALLLLALLPAQPAAAAPGRADLTRARTRVDVRLARARVRRTMRQWRLTP